MAVESARFFLSRSVEATETLGESLGRGLGAGSVVALIGDLGAGKTALARGLARGLEVVDPITSPTFTLMQQAQGRLPLYHFDAWLAGREASFLAGGAAEYLEGAGVALVEWADRVAEYLPCPRLEVRLDHRGPSERAISLSLVPPGGDGDREQELAGLLAELLRDLAAGPGLEERDEPRGGSRVGGGG